MRLFDKGDAREFSELRRLKGERPRSFVEGRRNGEGNRLRFEGIIGESMVPRGAEVAEVEGADFDGRPSGGRGLRVGGVAERKEF